MEKERAIKGGGGGGKPYLGASFPRPPMAFWLLAFSLFLGERREKTKRRQK
jgi:hypothetical protein